MLNSHNAVRTKKVTNPIKGKGGKKKTKAFTGSDLFGWLLSHVASNEKEALDIAQLLLDESLIIEVSAKDLGGSFQNGNSAYRTTFENKSAFLCSRGMTTFYFDEFWNNFKDVETVEFNDKFLRLSSYVPRLVFKDVITQNCQPIECPYLTSFPACVLFADISGFTPLCETLGKRGKLGIELLTRHLNAYFGRMIGLIRSHGGDVIKFAGDALLAAWPCESESSLPFMVTLVSQCALAMQLQLHGYLAEGCSLTLHIGIGAGKISGVHLGGVNGRSEFILAGEPLDQVSECEKAAASGEIYISKEAANIIADNIMVSVGSSKKTVLSQMNNRLDFPNYKLEEIVRFCSLPDMVPIPQFENMLESISPYAQPAVKSHLDSGAPDHFLAEIRPVSIIFVNLDLTYSDEDIERIQAGVCAMQDAVYEYEGVIRQFIIDDKGSVLIAAFGLPPLFHENDTVLAVKSCILLQEKLNKLNISTSIGITTGEVFCGAVGNSDRREYALVGDLVNLSARLMGNAKGGILVDIVTYTKSKNFIEFEDLDTIMVKGKKDPIRIFQPKSLKKSPKHASMVVSMFTSTTWTRPPIARSKDLKKLMKMIKYFQLHEKPMQVLVKGAAGVGKSYLLQLMTNQVDGANDDYNTKILHSVCDQDQKDKNYNILNNLLLDYIGKSRRSFEQLEPEERTEILIEKLSKKKIENAEMAFLLDAVFPFELFENEESDFEPKKKKLLLQKMLVDIITSMGKVILTIDNSQWMDSLSIELVKNLSAIPNVMIIMFERSSEERSNFIESRKSCKVITIESFSHDEIAELIKYKLSVKSVEDELVDTVYEKSSGNPYNALQFLDGLIALDELVIKDKVATLMSSADNLPKNLHSVVISKIDRLPRTQAITLKYASVIGTSFRFEALLAICDVNSDVLIEFLDDFIGLGLIKCESTENQTYQFTQDTIQEIIYEMMLFSQRQEVHQKVAELYEKNFIQWEIRHSVLARQYMKAENLTAAIRHFDIALDESSSNFAYENVIKDVEQILSIFPAPTLSKKLSKEQSNDNQKHVRWRRLKGEAFFALGRFEEARPVLENALEISGEVVNIKENKYLIKDSKKIFNLSVDRNLMKQSKRRLKNTKGEVTLHFESELIRCLVTLGKIYYFNGNLSELIYCALTAKKKIGSIGVSGGVIDGLALSIIVYGLENISGVEKLISDTNEITSQIQLYNGVDAAGVLWMISLYFLGKGQFLEFENLIHQSLEIHEERGTRRGNEETVLTVLFCDMIRGRIIRASELHNKMTSKLLSKGYHLIQSLLFAAEMDILSCKYSSAIQKINEMNQYSYVSLDVLTRFNLSCFSAYGLLLQKKFNFALQQASDLCDQLDGMSFTSPYTFLGLAILPAIYYLACKKDSENQKTLEQFTHVVESLKRFSDIFPFAYPRYMFWNGILATLLKIDPKPIWETGYGAVINLGMYYDEGILLYRLGYHEIGGDIMVDDARAKLRSFGIDNYSEYYLSVNFPDNPLRS